MAEAQRSESQDTIRLRSLARKWRALWTVLVAVPLAGVPLVVGLMLALDQGSGLSAGDAAVEASGGSAAAAHATQTGSDQRLAPTRDAVLLDRWGRHRSIQEFSGYEALVLVFLGIDCPVANLYVPQVLQLEQELRSRGVQFLAVYPHAHETLDEIAAHAVDRNIPFPVLKDLEQQLADSLGATRTPEVCVLDRDLRLVYRGRISDQYGVNDRRPIAKARYLADAVEAALMARPYEPATTPADGCLLDRSRPTQVGPPPEFHADVAPILARRCATCHDGTSSSAPFRLADYPEAVRWSSMIREVLIEQRMPPWQADARYGHFTNDRRMPADEVRTVLAWIEGGQPLGPVPSTPPSGANAVEPPPREWTPDLIFEVDHDYAVPADGAVSYQYFNVLEEQLEPFRGDDIWISAAMVEPSSPGVVHHVMVFVVPPGYEPPPGNLEGISVLTIWAPGEPAFRFPPDSGIRIPKGSRLVVQVHYTPNGQATRDKPRILALRAVEKPKYEIGMWTHENRGFRIAPGDQHSQCRSVFLVKDLARTQLIGLFPHLHLRGKSFAFQANFPDGRREVLLSVPRYDFNWQTLYWFAEPVHLPIGTRVHSIAYWDNSRNNPVNPDPTQEVRYGQQTWDEMMVSGMMFIKPAE